MTRKKSSRIRLHEEDKAILDEIKQMTTTSARDIQRLKRGIEITHANLKDHSHKLRQISKATKRNKDYMKRSTELLNAKLNAQEMRLTKVKNKIKNIEKNTDPSNKTQGIFDFTFALIIFTLATICFSLSNSLGFRKITLLAISLGIFMYVLIIFTFIIKKRIDYFELNVIQIILSIGVILIYLMIIEVIKIDPSIFESIPIG